jgi:hypothetical protein
MKRILSFFDLYFIQTFFSDRMTSSSLSKIHKLRSGVLGLIFFFFFIFFFIFNSPEAPDLFHT